MKVDNMVDLKSFEKFTNLEIIEVSQYKGFKNFTAFICEPYKSHCKFTLGINEVACPLKCNCSYNRDKSQLEIDCWQKNLTTIPSLPVPKKEVQLWSFRATCWLNSPIILWRAIIT